MRYLTAISLLAGILVFQACRESPSRKEKLSGHWEALRVTEEERPLEVDPEEIQFWFYPNNTYEFRSTLNYREAGRYRLRQDYLFTTDTLAPGGQEKAVEILQLTPDTLTLRMIDQEKERRLELVKAE